MAQALDQQARNNIDVQVLDYWDPNNPSMPSMQTALQAVAPAGQQFPAWAQVNQARHANGTSIQICHAKFMLIDAGTANQQAFLMTANFTEAALGVGMAYNNREYVVIDTAQQDIAALTALFVPISKASLPRSQLMPASY